MAPEVRRSLWMGPSLGKQSYRFLWNAHFSNLTRTISQCVFDASHLISMSLTEEEVEHLAPLACKHVQQIIKVASRQPPNRRSSLWDGQLKRLKKLKSRTRARSHRLSYEVRRKTFRSCVRDKRKQFQRPSSDLWTFSDCKKGSHDFLLQNIVLLEDQCLM
jgi:hypothetical protein